MRSCFLLVNETAALTGTYFTPSQASRQELIGLLATNGAQTLPDWESTVYRLSTSLPDCANTAATVVTLTMCLKSSKYLPSDMRHVTHLTLMGVEMCDHHLRRTHPFFP